MASENLTFKMKIHDMMTHVKTTLGSADTGKVIKPRTRFMLRDMVEKYDKSRDERLQVSK